MRLNRSRLFPLAGIALAALLLGACGSGSTGSGATTTAHITLKVFAAASLTAPFNEIGQNFSAKHPGVTVEFNYAGSQQLAQQLTQGAQADVFASANQKQMDVATQGGVIADSGSRIFVRNRLIAIFPKDNPGAVAKLQDLAKPGLKIVLADKSAPVGQYALDFLDRASATADFGAGYKAEVLKNVVSYEQDVKAVLTKVSLGEADAGIVYTSDGSGDVASKIGKLDIPLTLQTVAAYPIAQVKTAPQADLARAFIDYVFTTEGQTILAKYGFTSLL